MKKLLIICFYLISGFVLAQNEQLAQNYFDRGEFEKAILIYEDLVKSSPGNLAFFQKQVACYQQLKQFEKADLTINNRLIRTNQPNLYIELGYNFQLQKNQEKANKNYDFALDKIKENPSFVYSLAREFEIKSLLNEAILAYKLGVVGNPNLNFDYQVALLQGQLGQTETMINTLLDYAFKTPENVALVQNQFHRFLFEDTQKTFTENLRKALLVRTQKSQELFWNQFLSWFFIQQKEYNKAFIQEKAIFKRTQENLYAIFNLSKLAQTENDDTTARTVLEFIIQNTQDQDFILNAKYQVLELDIKKATLIEFPIIQQQFIALLQQFGINPFTVKLQILQAHFEAFHVKNYTNATTILNKALELPLNIYQKNEVKMELADVLLINQKFNQSIIYYAQIEDELKNDAIAHEASFKMAKASYFNEDFEWAQKQFKVLKGSTSQLISNDSMELFLLISDNTVEDSTQVALKKFAKADFLAFQNKNEIALAQFKQLLTEHKADAIASVCLLRIGEINQKMQKYIEALEAFEQLIVKYPESIYIDEALFFSGEIYRKNLNDVEKAKANYEKIIFKHEDSIHFIEARNWFRKLRGDTQL